MTTSKELEDEINPVQDDLRSVATKLGLKDYQERDKITPTEKQLLRINGELDDDGNSYLIRFSKLGKSDIVEFLLKFDGIDVNHENSNREAAVDVAKNEKQELCLLKLLEADALFPPSLDAEDVDNEGLKTFLRTREKLHADIEAGDLKSVEDALRYQKPSIYLSKSNESALSWAASCEQIEIYAYLLGKGAKFLDQQEEDDCVIDDYRLEKLNDLRQDQLLKIENYHVQKLLYRSKSPQALTRKRYDILKGIYDFLNQFELISLIMKVLEYDDCDVVFDFENEHTNNLYRKEDIHAYGLTVRSMKRIFIGAKKCLSTDSVCKEVAGTLAHELCHMAMHVLYRNGARPYAATEESGSIGQEYKSVVKEISKSVEEKKTDIDVIIQQVFNYHRDQWECELIVRVPHILVSYGKEVGEQRLNSQAKGLYDFYMNHIVRDSSGYTNPAYFKRALCSIESLHTYHGCISEDDKKWNPFKVPLKSFRSNLVQKGIMQVLTTNIVKLGALHIYHEMKMTERYQIDKSCLFFRLDCFLKNFKDILKAFDCNVCRLMVLVCNEERVDIDDTVTYFYDMDIASRNKEIILVSNKECEMLSKGKALLGKSFDYFWTDFSESYKEECSKRTVNFKGNDSRLNEWIDMGNISKLVQSEDVSRLIAEEPLLIWDGRKIDLQGYKSYCYIERDLAKVTVDALFFQELPKSSALYISGLSMEESSEFIFDRERLQWLKGMKSDVEHSKDIFIRESKGGRPLSEEYYGIQRDSKFWLHFSENKFHFVALSGTRDKIAKYLRTAVFSEIKLIESSENRIVLISDDSGTGKSTLFSSFIRKINEYYPKHWVARINLIDHAHDNEDDIDFVSLEKIKKKSRSEEVLEVFFRMTGFKSSLDIFLMKKITKSEGLGHKCKVFIDGYDEVSSSYRENLMKLFKTLIMKTSMQVWITTRVHERIDLEVELSTCSFSLLQFSDEKQITFLDKLWKHKLLMSDEIRNELDFSNVKDRIGNKIVGILKNIEDNSDPLFEGLKKIISEVKDEAQLPSWDQKLQKLIHLVEELDFNVLSNSLLKSASIKDEEIKFTGIPLHLFMVGSLSYDKNLRVDIYSDLYGLYTEFVDGKIDIYWKEKLKITQSVVGTKKLYAKEKKRIFDLHMNVSEIVIYGGKSSKIDKKDVEDNDAGVGVGILSKTGDYFQFIHRTFAEYFFAEYILRHMEEDLLLSLLFESSFFLVNRFVCSGLDREDRRDKIDVSSFKNLRMESLLATYGEMFSERLPNKGKLLGNVMLTFESVCDEETVDDFLSKYAKFLRYKTYPSYLWAFWFLRGCLTDKMFADLYGKYIDDTFKVISLIITLCNEDELKEVLRELEEAYRTRSNYEKEYDHSSEDDDGNSLSETGERFETDLILKLVRCRDPDGYGILHLASANRNAGVFSVSLEFVERVVGEEEVGSYILETVNDGSNIMLISAMKGSFKIQEIFIAIKEKVSAYDLLTDVDGSGRNILHVIPGYLQPSSFLWHSSALFTIDDGETLNELLVQGDQNGKTVLHHMSEAFDSPRVDEMLQKLKEYLGEKEMKDLMKRRDNNERNIFHAVGQGASLYNLPIFEKYIEKEEMTDLLLQVDDSGRTCLHHTLVNPHVFSGASLLVRNVEGLSKVLSSESLEKLLLTRDCNKETFLHYAKDGLGFVIDFEEMKECYRKYLPESSFLELLTDIAPPEECS